MPFLVLFSICFWSIFMLLRTIFQLVDPSFRVILFPFSSLYPRISSPGHRKVKKKPKKIALREIFLVMPNLPMKPPFFVQYVKFLRILMKEKYKTVKILRILMHDYPKAYCKFATDTWQTCRTGI